MYFIFNFQYPSRNIRIRSDTNFWKYGYENQILQYFVHKKFQEDQYSYNVGLIQVVHAISGPKISYVNLPPSTFIYNPYSRGLVILTDKKNKIKKLQANILNNNKCKYEYKQTYKSIDNKIFCVDLLNKSQNSNNEHDEFFVQNFMVMGIKTWSQKFLPTLYIKLSLFKVSINSILNEGYDFNFVKFDLNYF